MTDLLTRDPNDTGEIPTADPGPDTKNLAPYAAVGPYLRKGELTEEVPYEPHTIGVVDFAPTRPTPDPMPPFPPPPPPPTPRVDDRPLSAGEEIVWARTWRPETPPRSWWGRLLYRGTHRQAGR